MRLSPFAYACFVLPCGVIVLCYLISARQVPDFPHCFPFTSGCVSISAAARQDPSIHLFRLVMLPLSSLLAAYWCVIRVWLTGLGANRRYAAAASALGVMSAFFLALYVVFLGTDGPTYGLLRRFGTTLYFGGSGLAQLLTAAALMQRHAALSPLFPPALIRLIFALTLALLGMGLMYLPAADLFRAHRVENILEWNFALLLHAHYGLVSILWRRQGLRLRLEGKGICGLGWEFQACEIRECGSASKGKSRGTDFKCSPWRKDLFRTP